MYFKNCANEAVMKKLLAFVLLFNSSWTYAENKIKMITYFPVPYVAYSKVQVDKVLDVGLTKICDMNLGCVDSGNAGLRPLSATDVYLKAGRLDLNRAMAIKGTSVTLGTGFGEHQMNFLQNLRIGTLNNGYSLETNQMTVNILKLFPERISNDFPSCAATGASGAPQVSWQKIKIKDQEETFLVCGMPKKTAPSCVVGEWSSKKVLAPASYNAMLSNDCSYVGCSGDPNAACSGSGLSQITQTCTDYYTISRSSYATTPEMANIGMSDQDTCNGDDRSAYLCDGSKTSCVDIRLGGSAPGYPQWKQQNTFFNCANGWTSSINWNYSSILEVPECGAAGNFSDASKACSYFRKGPGGQDNFFCYKQGSYHSEVCSGYVSNPIQVTYLQNCPSYVRYNITCAPQVEYKVRTITCE